jgi:hypothetical protein
VEKVKERLPDGRIINIDQPIQIKDEEMLKHMKHIYDLDVVHNYFKYRASDLSNISTIRNNPIKTID